MTKHWRHCKPASKSQPEHHICMSYCLRPSFSDVFPAYQCCRALPSAVGVGGGEPIDASALGPLSCLSGLHSLRLQLQNVPSSGWEFLQAMPQLTCLSLRGEK